MLAALLPHRGLVAVSGPGAQEFLQGLISNDVRLAGPDRALWAALLTPQGKFLHDLFVLHDGERIFLECERDRRQDLLKRLRLYKLRAKVELEDLAEAWTVAVAFGTPGTIAPGLPAGAAAGEAVAFAGGRAFVDPRLPDLGWRIWLPAEGAEQALAESGLSLTDPEAYERHRLALGVPDGSRELEVDRALLLESGFDELHGIDWKKGCWMGQELTARTKYRGLVKKRLLPVAFEGAPPPAGAPVLRDGRDIGTFRGGVAGSEGGIGLALLRLEALAPGAPLEAEGVVLHPRVPDWVSLPPDVESSRPAG